MASDWLYFAKTRDFYYSFFLKQIFLFPIGIKTNKILLNRLSSVK